MCSNSAGDVNAYYAIQRLVVRHSDMEVKLLMHDLIVEAMNKHDHDAGD